VSDRSERARAALERARGLEGQKVEAIAAPALFPTPRELARRIIELADIKDGMRILEPSAGTGALLDAIREESDETRNVYAVEINSSLAARLDSKYESYSIIQADFLSLNAEYWGFAFDRIIMNPPFDHGLDIKHILHARSLLAPSGRLVAICADGSRQREAFENSAAFYERLPANTFASQGTGVHTALVVLEV
jgi:phospholipid N-methyltransferase